MILPKWFNKSLTVKNILINLSFVNRILIKHFYDHNNKFTHRYIYIAD